MHAWNDVMKLVNKIVFFLFKYHSLSNLPQPSGDQAKLIKPHPAWNHIISWNLTCHAWLKHEKFHLGKLKCFNSFSSYISLKELPEWEVHAECGNIITVTISFPRKIAASTCVGFYKYPPNGSKNGKMKSGVNGNLETENSTSFAKWFRRINLSSCDDRERNKYLRTRTW